MKTRKTAAVVAFVAVLAGEAYAFLGFGAGLAGLHFVGAGLALMVWAAHLTDAVCGEEVAA